MYKIFEFVLFGAFNVEGFFWFLIYRIKGEVKSKKDCAVPKIIHMCWFSGEPYPRFIHRCIHSWKKYLPDYRIVLWDKRKALSTGIPFVEEAINAEKYAFAADVIRLYAVYKYGGVYMDSDIMVKSRFESFLNHQTVFFREYYPERVMYETVTPNISRDEKWGSAIQAALFAGVEGAPLIGEILDYYRTLHFKIEDLLHITVPIAPQIFARILERYDFSYEDISQLLPYDTFVYAYGPVARCSKYDTEQSFAVHCCSGSWKSPDVKFWGDGTFDCVN